MMKVSRRNFLAAGSASAAAMGSLAPQFSIAQSLQKVPLKSNNKVLVYIMLDGGNDSFNMLVPTSASHYAQYSSTRDNLAVPLADLLSLNGFSDSEGRSFGVHKAMSEVQSLFNNKKLSFVANVGPLVEPVDRAGMQAGTAKLPLGLLSHSDQFKHWLTGRPDERTNTGWFGRFADSVQANRQANQIPMNISLAGSNILQNGADSTHYTVNKKGSVGLAVKDKSTPANQALNNALLAGFEAMLNQSYGDDPMRAAYIAQTRESQAQHERFKAATNTVTLSSAFSDSNLSQQLKKVAESIASADQMNLQQQTYFLRYIGWDHHDGLLDKHPKMLSILSKALFEFQRALEELNVEDRVITFTGSDFGRTLTSNGNGSDHGWGGNAIVMGEPVDGGKVFGEFPSLELGNNNPLDGGDGMLIPSMPLDKMFAELAIWYGVEGSDVKTLLPNIEKFGGIEHRKVPVGFALKSSDVTVLPAGAPGSATAVPTMGAAASAVTMGGLALLAKSYHRRMDVVDSEGQEIKADN